MPIDRTHAHPGLFLVLDGPDGGGKTTQARRLADWLAAPRVPRRQLPRPRRNAPGGPAAEHFARQGDCAALDGAEMLLYMASRRSSSKM